MQDQRWQCPRCSYEAYEVDEMRATGGAFSKIFDVQNKKFTTVSCERCRYTEFYKAESSALGNIFDFFTS